jgi:hypothetical protein
VRTLEDELVVDAIRAEIVRWVVARSIGVVRVRERAIAAAIRQVPSEIRTTAACGDVVVQPKVG